MPSSQLSRLDALTKMVTSKGARGTKSRTTAAQFSALYTIYSRWIKLDPVKLQAVVGILAALATAFATASQWAPKITWWFTKFFTTSVTISSSDPLSTEIRSWVESKVLMPRLPTCRELVASSKSESQQSGKTETRYEVTEKLPLKIMPIFGTPWFIFQGRVFVVQAPEPASKEKSSERASLIIQCLGRSAEPVKKFLDTCHDFAESQKEKFTTIWKSQSNPEVTGFLFSTTQKPIRDMETIYLEENVKTELLADVKNYLDPDNRNFYESRGIPYRRGYLLHGPPGTGKTSLSAGLAGYFGLDLYLIHVPSIPSDDLLEELLTEVPPRSVLLLEDIDAVGLKRSPGEDHDKKDSAPKARCTLSGLLNALDGVTSQTGRIVLMTSNFPEKLDEALIRPGRIDKKIYLGHISQSTATTMFLAWYTCNGQNAIEDSDHVNELAKQAEKFSSQIPENTLTPAQLQGYLIQYRSSPEEAANGVKAWLDEENKKKEEADARVQEAMVKEAEQRAKMSAMKKGKKSKTPAGQEEADDPQEDPSPSSDDNANQSPEIFEDSDSDSDTEPGTP